MLFCIKQVGILFSLCAYQQHSKKFDIKKKNIGWRWFRAICVQSVRGTSALFTSRTSKRQEALEVKNFQIWQSSWLGKTRQLDTSPRPSWNWLSSVKVFPKEFVWTRNDKDMVFCQFTLGGQRTLLLTRLFLFHPKQFQVRRHLQRIGSRNGHRIAPASAVCWALHQQRTASSSWTLSTSDQTYRLLMDHWRTAVDAGKVISKSCVPWPHPAHLTFEDREYSKPANSLRSRKDMAMYGSKPSTPK